MTSFLGIHWKCVRSTEITSVEIDEKSYIVAFMTVTNIFSSLKCNFSTVKRESS